MFGGSFKIQEKNPNIKIFSWGGLRGPKILYAEILHVFYFRLILRVSCCCMTPPGVRPKIRRCPSTVSYAVPNLELATGKYGCTEVRVYHAECIQQLGRDPSKIGSSKSLVLKSFFWTGNTLGLLPLVSLTFWDTPGLFAPPLSLPK